MSIFCERRSPGSRVTQLRLEIYRRKSVETPGNLSISGVWRTLHGSSGSRTSSLRVRDLVQPIGRFILRPACTHHLITLQPGLYTHGQDAQAESDRARRVRPKARYVWGFGAEWAGFKAQASASVAPDVSRPALRAVKCDEKHKAQSGELYCLQLLRGAHAQLGKVAIALLS